MTMTTIMMSMHTTLIISILILLGIPNTTSSCLLSIQFMYIQAFHHYILSLLSLITKTTSSATSTTILTQLSPILTTLFSIHLIFQSKQCSTSYKSCRFPDTTTPIQAHHQGLQDGQGVRGYGPTQLNPSDPTENSSLYPNL